MDELEEDAAGEHLGDEGAVQRPSPHALHSAALLGELLLDRYGPVPERAERLLAIGRLRAACARTGVREVAVARDVARISPITLRTSAAIRLQRLHPKAVYKEEIGQIVVPLPRGAHPADFLTELLGEMVPVETTSVA